MGNEIERLQDFAKWAIREGAFQAADIGGLEIQEKAQELGLIEPTTYDPDKHGPSDCAETGDEWFVFTAALDSAEDAKAEPVAFLHETKHGDRSLSFETARNHHQWTSTPLYATQPDAETTRLRERVAELTFDLKVARTYGDEQSIRAHRNLERAEAAEARLAQAEGGPAVTEAAREFMALFARDEGLTLEDIDPNEMAQKYDALEAALSQPQPPAEARIAEPAVKVLNWIGNACPTTIGVYRVKEVSRQWVLTYENAFPAYYDSLTDAKAAAQADYEARIRAALSPATGEGK